MGRHRRSAAGRAATGRAADGTQPDGHQGHQGHQGHHGPHAPYEGEGPGPGIAPYPDPDPYAGTYARTEAFLHATDDDHSPAPDTLAFPADGHAGEEPGHEGGPAPAGGHRRRRRKAAPVRAGLLGVSAAVAIGAAAVATGVVPGLDGYRFAGDPGASGHVRADGSVTSTPSGQGGTSGPAEDRDGTPGHGHSRSSSPSASPSPSASTSSAAPTTEAPTKEPEKTPSGKTERTPTREATKAPAPDEPPVTLSEEAAAGARVLRLVNDERARAGCSPVAANSALADLASDFSEDMAERDFFDHTDPDGATPWDRAEKAGISGLGGENIARGQSTAAAVMDAWMNSPGHRANILNCDFKTLGVGVHFAQGGPWWTQDFGY
ncbi:MAG TPA: CAP domain-containing protein [Streptomyces sp.]|nr:CAP domain-containing protein [Streptomyces sp.]